MAGRLEGQIALFTGPVTPITLAAARRLGREGAHLVFAGAQVQDDGDLLALERQIPRRVARFVGRLGNREDVRRVAGAVERTFGRLDLLIHTLGAGDAAPAATPLTFALTCSGGAIEHMQARAHGHVLHLVTRAEVGATEVERIALDRLRQNWAQTGPPTGIVLSALYFEGPALLPASPEPAGETRILEAFTGRLMDEDEWVRRVMVEEEIGNLVVRACACRETAAPGDVRSYEYPEIAAPLPGAA